MSQGDPHDHLFRYGFGQSDVARAHFKAYLPAAIVDGVDWTGLEQMHESFIDEELKKTESDLLYRAPLKAGGEIFLYVLFEHQRSRDYRMPLRLLGYMVRIWTKWEAEHGGSPRRKPQLPLIVPMVLYNGKKRWTVGSEFIDLFPAGEVRDAMRSMIPNFGYDMLDLSQTPDDDIQGAALGQMVLLLLKWADRDDFWERLPAWLKTMETILNTPSHGIGTIEAMLRYIMSVAAGPLPDAIRPQLRQHLTPRVEETLMTWAEQLKQQGIEQGKQIGIEQGIEQGAAERDRAEQLRRTQQVLRMLRLKFGEADEATVLRVEAGSIEELERWTERILLAEICEDVFAE
ncbi:MAG: putative transposase/invertase (TIGR01784 family) [Myxococcota bacterium]|jgi:predicted transposase/invertase (TIGR01784 family)